MLRALSLAVAAVAFLLGGTAWLAFYPPVPADLDGARDLDPEARHVRIPVAEGDSLDGWVIEGREPGVILLLHGYGRKHDRTWRYAGFLEHEGYTLMTVDFRSSRARDRLPTTLGHHEREDAAAAWAWMRAQPWGRRQPAGVLGESLGGSVALLLAAEQDDVLAVVADCPFATGERALEDAFKGKVRLPRWPAVPIARALGRMTTGFDPGGIDVTEAARMLDDRPLYFIHAGRDDRMATSQAHDLWRAAGAKDPIWLIEDGRHNEAWQHHREDYEARITEFFETHLRTGLRDAGMGPRRAMAR
jgi:dienelactone hydrolase